jgi:hypothetical protein
MLFPLVIFLSQMLNFTIALPVFFGSFLVLCLWPVFWNLVGFVATTFWKRSDRTLSEQIYAILFSLSQFLSPLIGMKLLSGQPIAKALGGAISQVANPTSSLKGLTHSKGNRFSSTNGPPGDRFNNHVNANLSGGRNAFESGRSHSRDSKFSSNASNNMSSSQGSSHLKRGSGIQSEQTRGPSQMKESVRQSSENRFKVKTPLKPSQKITPKSGAQVFSGSEGKNI